MPQATRFVGTDSDQVLRSVRQQRSEVVPAPRNDALRTNVDWRAGGGDVVDVDGAIAVPFHLSGEEVVVSDGERAFAARRIGGSSSDRRNRRGEVDRCEPRADHVSITIARRGVGDEFRQRIDAQDLCGRRCIRLTEQQGAA